MMNQPKAPQIFIAHASEDKPQVRELYHRLLESGFNPWLDEKKLLPGQNWRDEIPKALRSSDFLIVCLSSRSVSKRGYIQREFKQALTLLAEIPTGTIYLIPLKLDDCEIPDLRQNEYGINLRDYQWVNYWEDDSYEKLVMSIKYEWEKQGNQLPESNTNSSILAHSLNENWLGITKTRGICGGDACIAGTRIPIWVLVNARNLGISEPQLLYDYPTLTATDLANAWIYAQDNPDEIATAIRENEED